MAEAVAIRERMIRNRFLYFAKHMEDQIPSTVGMMINLSFMQAEANSCGCAACCDSCWIDCCATNCDVEIFQEMCDQYDYKIYWCGLERIK